MLMSGVALLPIGMIAFAVAGPFNDDAPPASNEEAHQRVSDSIRIQAD